MPSLLGTGPGVHYKSLKTVNQSLKHKVTGAFWVCVWTNASCQLRELLLVDCSIQLDRPQRRLYRQISLLSVVQCSRCLTPSGDESVLDHCCTPAQNRRGSLGSGVCGLWTSPVPPWTGFCTRRAASVAPSALGIRGHAATIPEVDVRRRSGPVAKELWWKTADRNNFKQIVAMQVLSSCSSCVQTLMRDKNQFSDFWPTILSTVALILQWSICLSVVCL